MRGAAQIENLVKKAKNYTNNIRICAMSDGMRAILQVTKCTGVPHYMLFAKDFSRSFGVGETNCSQGKDSSEFVLKRF